ncbi:MAG: GNAT family N-acetyltransferase [Balneola sp.]|nr:GNAT family N-acetyltransferase [Balneola sp.]|tara:strand:+ start:14893 stop:15435 length:543 start_codon:yes stop_codon:yes gene_type:complete
MSLAVSELTTQRLSMRPIQDEDLENIYHGLSHPRVIKHYGVSYSTLEETKEQMKWYLQLRENETGTWWAMEKTDSGEFVGAIGLNDIKKEHRRGEIGFWLLPEFWGNGYVTESIPAVLAFGFGQLNLHRIEAWVNVGNSASSKVLNKAGFNYEGTLIDYEIKNGLPLSIQVFAKIVDNVV